MFIFLCQYQVSTTLVLVFTWYSQSYLYWYSIGLQSQHWFLLQRFLSKFSLKLQPFKIKEKNDDHVALHLVLLCVMEESKCPDRSRQIPTFIRQIYRKFASPVSGRMVGTMRNIYCILTLRKKKWDDKSILCKY